MPANAVDVADLRKSYGALQAVRGISFTVAEVLPKSFTVWIIPITKRYTNLDRAQVGDPVNLEFDLLAKYVERILPRQVPQG